MIKPEAPPQTTTDRMTTDIPLVLEVFPLQ